MTPLLIGLLAGVVAAAVLTFAYHRLRGSAALVVFLGTLFASLLPRLYFGLGAYQGTTADLAYTGAWMLVVTAGFWLGVVFGGKPQNKRS